MSSAATRSIGAKEAEKACLAEAVVVELICLPEGKCALKCKRVYALKTDSLWKLGWYIEEESACNGR